MTVRALIIGINYSHRSFSLRFGESDANRFREFLQRHYPSVQVTMMIGTKATKAALLQALNTIVDRTQPGDLLFLYFSGHGTYIHNPESNEFNGKDEAILTWDSPNFKDVEYLITDDQFYQILSQLPVGSTFRAVIDACHSGTMLDLDGVMDLVPGTTQRIVIFRAPKKPKGSRFDGLLLSSSQDSQKSYENSGGGMMTSVLIQQNPRVEILKLLERLRSQLSDQTPVISSTQPRLDWKLFPDYN